MPPAEKMAQRLDRRWANIWMNAPTGLSLNEQAQKETDEEIAALIRRLAAALVAYDRGLELVGNERTSQIFRIAYADALRDVKEEA